MKTYLISSLTLILILFKTSLSYGRHNKEQYLVYSNVHNRQDAAHLKGQFEWAEQGILV